jgi:hypothetical protein
MPPLTLDAYQNEACKTDLTRQRGKPRDVPLLGLFGEVGSLMSEVKKKQRDPTSYVGYEAAVIEELGDVLWYLTIIADRSNIRLSTVARYEGSTASSNEDLSFSAIQQQALLPLQSPTPGFERTLIQLASSTGTLMSHSISSDSPAPILPILADVFKSLVRAADQAHVTLAQAAERNLTKTLDRWPITRNYPPLFDEQFPLEERLPRTLTVEIFERVVNNKTYVIQRCNKIFIGDRLTDNIITADDYRFHDAFHYAYAAILGWSPVIRALFRLKRKSNPVIDNAEDGARAILIEEGVATFLFGQAKQLDFFQGQNSGDLSFTLLKTVRQFVHGYEPQSCPLWLWEEAILEGNKAFRYLRTHRRAKLRLDLTNRKLGIEPMNKVEL